MLIIEAKQVKRTCPHCESVFVYTPEDITWRKTFENGNVCVSTYLFCGVCGKQIALG